jgi:hypothetical protein
MINDNDNSVLYTTLATVGVAAVAGVAWALSKGKINVPSWNGITSSSSSVPSVSSSAAKL